MSITSPGYAGALQGANEVSSRGIAVTARHRGPLSRAVLIAGFVTVLTVTTAGCDQSARPQTGQSTTQPQVSSGPVGGQAVQPKGAVNGKNGADGRPGVNGGNGEDGQPGRKGGNGGKGGNGVDGGKGGNGGSGCDGGTNGKGGDGGEGSSGGNGGAGDPGGNGGDSTDGKSGSGGNGCP